jgi:putative DNA primase/helicase
MNAPSPNHYADPATPITDALRYLSPDCDRETWILLGMAVKSALGDAGFPIWDGWSQGGDTYRAKDAQAAWRSFKADGKIGVGTLYHLAKQAGWKAPGGALPPLPAPKPRAETEAAERALERQRDAVARKAWNIFRYAPRTDSHPYLTRKHIKGHGARLSYGKLVIPLYAGPKRLVNLQFIDGDGTKRFLSGGRKAGCFWWIGRQPTKTVCLAEGFATAASIHEATLHRCYLAFDAGNLPAVAEAVRALHPDSRIVICADHDPTGIKYAGIAAARIDGYIATPEREGQDFNDVAGGCHG